MRAAVFIVYPCGKKMELHFPIEIIKNGETKSILPGTSEFFSEAKKQYEIGNLRVIEDFIYDDSISGITKFISIIKKVKV